MLKIPIKLENIFKIDNYNMNTFTALLKKSKGNCSGNNNTIIVLFIPKS